MPVKRPSLWTSIHSKGKQPTSHVINAPTHHSTPVVRPSLCASIMGMEPYRPKGDSSRYSNTSRLYRRYGSEVAAVQCGEGKMQSQHVPDGNGKVRITLEQYDAPHTSHETKYTACPAPFALGRG